MSKKLTTVPPIAIEIESGIARTDDQGHITNSATRGAVVHLKQAMQKSGGFEGPTVFELRTIPSMTPQDAGNELAGLIAIANKELISHRKVEQEKEAQEIAEYEREHTEATAAYDAWAKENPEEAAELENDPYADYDMGREYNAEVEKQALTFRGLPTTFNSGYGNSEFGEAFLYYTGLHLHAGIPFNRQKEIQAKLEPYAPLLLALTASSPFDQDGNPDYASYRMISREKQGRYFRAREEKDPLEPEREPRFIDRPETLECLVMDSTSNIEDITSVTAIYQALITKAMNGKMNELLSSEEMKTNMREVAINGLDAELVTTNGTTLNTKLAITKMVEEIIPEALAIGSENEVMHSLNICRDGTSADRQKALYIKVLAQHIDTPEAREHWCSPEDYARCMAGQAVTNMIITESHAMGRSDNTVNIMQAPPKKRGESPYGTLAEVEEKLGKELLNHPLIDSTREIQEHIAGFDEPAHHLSKMERELQNGGQPIPAVNPDDQACIITTLKALNEAKHELLKGQDEQKVIQDEELSRSSM